MNTAQDIREKVFEAKKFGGYDMNAVDDFLEELANDMAACQKENAVLKSKLKVLVDKIEEYRANEDAANKVLLSAQKLASQIENDARTRAASIMANAEAQANAVIGSITEAKEDEERKLAAAQEATAKYFDAVRKLCTMQLGKLDAIISDYVVPVEEPAEEPVEEPAEEPAPAAFDLEEAVRSIENSVSRVTEEEPVEVDFSAIDASAEDEDSDSNGAASFSF